VGAAHGYRGDGYGALHHWSVEAPERFWQAVADYSEVRFHAPATAVLSNGDAFPGARWFEGATLNYAEHLLRHRGDAPAIISTMEDGATTTLTQRELYRRVAHFAAALKAQGLTPGDRVAGWLPNSDAAVIAMLATTALGGVWSSCSPDFGAQGALDRFGQIEASFLIACDGYRYSGKTFEIRDKVASVASELAGLKALIIVPVLAPVPAGELDFEALSDARGTLAAPTLTFASRRFDDPLYIMYSSGTTGVPKCIVHGVGGTLLQHQKEHLLHNDLHRDDRLFFFTTCGWMMWNWLVSALGCGCTIVLYDGSPFHPGPTRLLDLAQAQGVTHFGVSAKYLSAIASEGLEPKHSHDLTRVRQLLSTGSPLTEEGFDYVYSAFPERVQLVSMSGGTDILSCFVLGHPIAPIYRGEIPAPGLGMAVEVWDDDGERLIDEKGELVCTAPFPSAPLGFWNDTDGERFRSAYFDRYPGVWAQGDFAAETANAGFVIYGRSDAVLNPGGVRIGTAEIYRQVERFDAIFDAVCVGQEWQDDVRVVLFVVLRDGQALSKALIAELKAQIRTGASPRHVPAVIHAVPDIPRTRSGKIAELAVRDAIHGRPVKNTGALANPEALAYFTAPT
ncbi:MAG: acetoacetate--CoA ligase, partial [Pseudomonadota bacterium]